MSVMRVKSHWFKPGTPKTPQQNASALAFIVWRVAQNMLKQMRAAQFDIDVGPQYFAFMREVLVFLIQIVDRMAYERMPEAVRTEFTTALVRRVAEILDDSESDLLGAPPDGEESHRAQFIELFNQLSDDYAYFNYGADGPDFAFTRYLGSRVTALMVRKDKTWALDQIMAIEAPEAVATLQSAMQGVLSTEPRPARRHGVSGD
ncbi:MAG TPA: hypothetical protein VJ608_12115 [Albitalea sp.]|nr:hypothetical protein [Albitalea sp.]